MLSFLLLLSSASTIAILSEVTSTSAAVNSFKSKLIVALPLDAPPVNPSPATTSVISAPPNAASSDDLASGTPPAVEPSCTTTVFLSVSIVISPASPVNVLC